MASKTVLPSKTRVAKLLLLLLVLLPMPALLARWVSKHPVLWAYRIYHPFFYRYPVRFTQVAKDAEFQLLGMPVPDKSIHVARLMLEYW